jgi:2-haloacid dehalogenase
VTALPSTPKAVVFDLGGVLFDWNPEPAYRALIPDAAERAHFLANVCNHAWRVKQDAGQSLAEGTDELAARHPQHAALIRQFYGLWPQMLQGTLPAGLAIFNRLRATGVPLYALTNWAAETWPYAVQHHPFLQGFRQTVVSGEVGMVKPDLPIYRLTHEAILRDLPGTALADVVFIDDTLVNVEAADRFGWRGIHHTDAQAARTATRLREFGLPLPT